MAGYKVTQLNDNITITNKLIQKLPDIWPDEWPDCQR